MAPKGNNFGGGGNIRQGMDYICEMAVPDFESMLVDSSRIVADMVVSQVGRDSVQMDELYRLAIEKTGKLAMRSARAFDLVDEAEPGMAAPYISKIRSSISTIKHQSVVRCFLRTMLRYPLPADDEDLGRYYQFAIDLIQDSKKPIALRYYGMFIAHQIALDLPDLRFELLPLFDEVMRDDQGALKSRARIFKTDLVKKFGME